MEPLIGALLAALMFFILFAKNKLIDVSIIRNIYILLVVLSVIYLIYDKFQNPNIKFSFILLISLITIVNVYKIFSRKKEI